MMTEQTLRKTPCACYLMEIKFSRHKHFVCKWAQMQLYSVHQHFSVIWLNALTWLADGAAVLGAPALQCDLTECSDLTCRWCSCTRCTSTSVWSDWMLWPDLQMVQLYWVHQHFSVIWLNVLTWLADGAAVLGAPALQCDQTECSDLTCRWCSCTRCTSTLVWSDWMFWPDLQMVQLYSVHQHFSGIWLNVLTWPADGAAVLGAPAL